MFRLSAHPAAIGISEGVNDAFNYLMTSWKRWLPVVVAIAACTYFVYVLIGSIDLSNVFTTS